MKKVLQLVVEPQFLGRHVGVRRVIQHYHREFELAGWAVSYAAPCGDALRVSNRPIRSSDLIGEHDDDFSDRAWESTGGESVAEFLVRVKSLPRIQADSREVSGGNTWADPVSPNDADLSLLTAPWVPCGADNPLRAFRFSGGIVYDLVPLQLALGLIRFDKHFPVVDFAYEHRKGFEFYEQFADRILTISGSSLRDYESFFPRFGRSERSVAIPFSSSYAQSASPYVVDRVPLSTARVLAVNALDWRKNFATISKVLASAASLEIRDVVVIGRERISHDDAVAFFESLVARDVRVTWIRDATDSELAREYSRASFVFFPSLYEGLGYPILEAQAVGTPVVSSNNSSCGEINLNPSLMTDPRDVEGFQRIIGALTSSTKLHLEGQSLCQATEDFIRLRCIDPVNALCS
jgi:glycosyltransferase involved in cell wall biosynthesis